MEAFRLKTLLLHWLVEWQNWHDDHPKSRDFADTRVCCDLAEFIRSDFQNIEEMFKQADNRHEEIKQRICAPLRRSQND